MMATNEMKYRLYAYGDKGLASFRQRMPVMGGQRAPMAPKSGLRNSRTSATLSS